MIPAARPLLRVRNLKTNFYTYAGVVKALDGVSFDVTEGATMGLVGETGCGKSVTALSILRLIPQPPGKIEEGEVLFDLPEAAWREVNHLELEIERLLPRIFGNAPESHPPDFGARRLQTLLKASETKKGSAPSDVEAFRAVASALIRLKSPYDLLLKSDKDLRAIRGNKIAMIFQDPMQALNPVFPVGDQIAENILLHQEMAVTKAVVGKMELETERNSVARALRAAEAKGGGPRRAAQARPRSLTAIAFAWTALSLLTIGLFASSLAGIFTIIADGATAPLTAELVVSALAIFASVQILRERPIARLTGAAVALVELISKISLLALPAEAVFRLFFLLGLAMDLTILGFLTRPDASRLFQGRYAGLEGALRSAGGDTGRLLDLRDLLAQSALEEGTREAITARLDRLVAGANGLLKAGEPITGHFHPLLPWNAQLAYYRRRLARPGSGIYRWLKDKPVIGGLVARIFAPFEKPFYKEGITWAVDMLRNVRISDPQRIANQFPYELSGGMQQRALIAIALSCNPKLLIADEPTTALDVTIQAQILELIKEMKKAFGSTVLLITHDLGIIAEMCDRVCVMYAGHIAEDASVRAVFKHPLHPYTQGLLKAIPSHLVRTETLEIIPGSVPNLITPPPGCRFHPRCPFAMPHCGWSPSEVRDRLRNAISTVEKDRGWSIDVNGIEWEGHGPTELRVTFPGNHADSAVAAGWIQAAVDAGRAADVALQAVTGVVPAKPSADQGSPYHVEVRVLAPRKPPDYEPEPQHYVACVLYERERQVGLLEGHRVG